MEETNEEVDKKATGRKFSVWLIWLFISVLTFIIFGFVVFVTKTVPDNLVDLVKLSLKYFFFISAEYLGVNVIQKGIYAAKDVLGKADE